MIVLDEQLLGRGIEHDIARWYRGKVQFITDVRPHTVIKDDAIPALLRQQSQPTFVTINAHDFWQRVPGDPRYCLVCFVLSDARTRVIPHALRALFRHSEFRTKAHRMGKVIRVTHTALSYLRLKQDGLPRWLGKAANDQHTAVGGVVACPLCVTPSG